MHSPLTLSALTFKASSSPLTLSTLTFKAGHSPLKLAAHLWPWVHSPLKLVAHLWPWARSPLKLAAHLWPWVRPLCDIHTEGTGGNVCNFLGQNKTPIIMCDTLMQAALWSDYVVMLHIDMSVKVVSIFILNTPECIYVCNGSRRCVFPAALAMASNPLNITDRARQQISCSFALIQHMMKGTHQPDMATQVDLTKGQLPPTSPLTLFSDRRERALYTQFFSHSTSHHEQQNDKVSGGCEFLDFHICTHCRCG